MRLRNIQAVFALALIGVGVGWFSLPAAFIVVGVLLLVDAMTT